MQLSAGLSVLSSPEVPSCMWSEQRRLWGTQKANLLSPCPGICTRQKMIPVGDLNHQDYFLSKSCMHVCQLKKRGGGVS